MFEGEGHPTNSVKWTPADGIPSDSISNFGKPGKFPTPKTVTTRRKITETLEEASPTKGVLVALLVAL
jgi:hypothetical protein